jgi:hypothetical protein
MAGPLGGTDGDPGVPSTDVGDVNGAPQEVVSETRKHPPPMSETSMAGLLGGAIRDPGVPTTYFRDVDGAPLRGTVGDLRAPTTYVEGIDGGPTGRCW